MFADDWALVIQCITFEEGQHILEEDLKKIDTYFKFCRLIINPAKTEVSAFYLNNREAERLLVVNFNGCTIKHNFHPKYLGLL